MYSFLFFFTLNGTAFFLKSILFIIVYDMCNKYVFLCVKIKEEIECIGKLATHGG